MGKSSSARLLRAGSQIAVGLAVGFAGGWAVAGDPPEAGPGLDAPPTVTELIRTVRVVNPELQARMAAFEPVPTAAPGTEGLTELLVGASIPFDDEAHRARDEAELRARIAAELHPESTLHWVDCSSWPCIALLEHGRWSHTMEDADGFVLPVNGATAQVLIGPHEGLPRDDLHLRTRMDAAADALNHARRAR